MGALVMRTLPDSWSARLPERDRALYELLAKFRGQYVRADDLHAAVCPGSLDHTAITKTVQRLRRQMERDGIKHERIGTAKGFGYGLVRPHRPPR